jgi:hypothetical protein
MKFIIHSFSISHVGHKICLSSKFENILKEKYLCLTAQSLSSCMKISHFVFSMKDMICQKCHQIMNITLKNWTFLKSWHQSTRNICLLIFMTGPMHITMMFLPMIFSGVFTHDFNGVFRPNIGSLSAFFSSFGVFLWDSSFGHSSFLPRSLLGHRIISLHFTSLQNH